ncbi:MAG: hypothetical protein FJ298_07855 [Planctomycetes bacterium]|nr:hypothetical protein [Planctomycetota bacterium]
MTRSLAVVAFLAALAPPAFAQGANARYELGWRTRLLERAWMSTSREQHERALPQVEAAVQRFFAMDMAGVAAALDEARFSLAGLAAPRDLERFTVTPVARLIDADTRTLQLSVSSLYTTELAAPITLRASCRGVALPLEPARFEAPKPGERRDLQLSLHSLAGASGDFTIEIEIGNDGELRSRRELSVALAPKLQARLSSLRVALDALPEVAPALERETLRANVKLLESLAKASSEETDFPGAALLADHENIVARAAKGERWFGIERAGEAWMSVPNGKHGARVRVFVPEGLAAERKVPLVVALHGAGGSENMFFDAYGDGRIVGLCRERGWMLVAPRVGFTGAPVSAVVEALAERFPIDREQVLLIGHSMGAGMGQQLVAKDPATFRAFAALGGGSGFKDATGLASEPIFVGAGERDFGRRGAEALHKSLVGGGSGVARLKIYPACEHLMIVIDALPDVFEWWDGLLAAK